MNRKINLKAINNIALTIKIKSLGYVIWTIGIHNITLYNKYIIKARLRISNLPCVLFDKTAENI